MSWRAMLVQDSQVVYEVRLRHIYSRVMAADGSISLNCVWPVLSNAMLNKGVSRHREYGLQECFP